MDDDELKDFRPRVTTRPAKDVTERDFFSRQSWAVCFASVSCLLLSPRA